MNQNVKFFKLINSVIRLLLVGAVFLMFLHSLFSTSFVGKIFLEDGSERERTLNIADNPLRHLILFVFLSVSLILARRLWRAAQNQEIWRWIVRYGNYVFPGLLLFTLLAGTAYVLMTQFAPGSDPAKVYAIAMQWRQGDFSAFEEGGYLFCYPFQSGIVLCFYLFSFLFGMGNHVALQLIYVACLAFVYGLLAKLSTFFWPEKGLRNVVLICQILWVPLAFYVTYLYGILPGMALSLGAVWFAARYLSERRYRYIVLSSLCMGFATVIKMNCLIYLIAIACFLAYDVLESLVFSKDSQSSKEAKWKKGMISLIFVLCLAGSVALCNWTNNRIVERIAGQKLQEGIPMISWVVMGLQEAPLGPGGYNGYISNTYTDARYDAEEAAEVSKQELKNRVAGMLQEPLDKGIPFLARKTAFQWNDPTFICLDRTRGRQAAVSVPAFLNNLIYGRGSVRLSGLLNDMQTLIWLGVLLYLLLRWNSGNLYELMGAVIFLGGYLFHLFWESSASYTIPYFVLLIPYAVCGMAEWEDFLERGIVSLRKIGHAGTQETPGEEETENAAMRCKRTGTGFKMAFALAFCLLVLAFMRTNLFYRTIALNDDLQGFNASDQYYLRNN